MRQQGGQRNPKASTAGTVTQRRVPEERRARVTAAAARHMHQRAPQDVPCTEALAAGPPGLSGVPVSPFPTSHAQGPHAWAVPLSKRHHGFGLSPLTDSRGRSSVRTARPWSQACRHRLGDKQLWEDALRSLGDQRPPSRARQPCADYSEDIERWTHAPATTRSDWEGARTVLPPERGTARA